MNEKMQEYLDMSPFELKNILISMAERAASRKGGEVLNAGRGNPNFLNTTVREAFSYLNLFVTELADSMLPTPHLGLRPSREGIAMKLDKYLKENHRGSGVRFLRKSIRFAEEEFGLDPDDFVFELADAVLGDFYPSPPRMFPCTEKVVNAYLVEVLTPNRKPARGKFDLFATEGATAAMVYLFSSLKENKILREGDHIAIVTPIFSPYLEIPALNDFRLVEVFVEQSEELDWQIPDSELKKLEDPRIKAMFMVHPTNPTAVKLNDETLKGISRLVRTSRKNLIILTDTVYATFVDGFRSLVEVAPRNTVCVYSYSKFFGVTGWRLGVIMLHSSNVIDELISHLPAKEIAELDERYKMDSADPEKIKFIDRLEIDSRDVALAHTGGLSCPQQCIMCLFSIFYLMDKKLAYKKAIHATLRKRINYLYDNLGMKFVKGPDQTYYYTLVDIGSMARSKYGDEFAGYLTGNVLMVEFLFRLAREKFIICLPGEGFAAPGWSLRISLANLDDEAYKKVGEGISDILEEYHRAWLQHEVE